MFEALLAALSLVAISEFGDRSQLAALLLGARYQSHHKKVFAGAILAFALLFLISVVVGSVMLSYIPENIVRAISSAAFIAMGLYVLLKREEEKVTMKKDKEPFLASFSLIALSEIGDKTQIAIIFLAASFHDPLGTFIGAMIAETAMAGMAIFAGKKIAERIKMHWIKYFSGVIFILLGFVSFLKS